MAARAEAEKTIKSVFAAQYAKRAAVDMLVLAERLMESAAKGEQAAAERYVLWEQAAALSAAAGEAERWR